MRRVLYLPSDFLQNNVLSGSIPNEIAKLSLLSTLSLGYNNITGT